MDRFPSVIPTKKIKAIQFSVQSPEIRKSLSFVDIEDYSGIESGISKPHSLYDLRMGTVLNKVKCATCKHGVNKDCGHFGMIKLAVPIFNILYLDHIKNVLISTCYRCGSFLITDNRLIDRILRYPKHLRMNYVKHYAISKKYNTCLKCRFVNDIAYKISKGFDIQFRKKKKGGADSPQKFKNMDPTVVLSNFKNLLNRDIEVMGFDIKRSRPEWFIMEEILVPGTPIRPSIISNEGNQRSESNIYKHLSGIIKANNKLSKELETKNVFDDGTYEFYEALCFAVASLFTDKLSKKSIGGIMSLGSGKVIISIKEMYKDKTGLIRGNLCGKRVDYSSRSVISSESMFMIDELGVPEYICKNLTITEIVNMYNIERLKHAVSMGKRRYPGATRVVKAGDGKDRYILLIGNDKKLKKIAENLKYGDIVYRHLVDGDPVIFNRQPSLHKLSIMGFFVRVVYGLDSFRINNSATGPFNADYDGDEMNMYVTHSEESIAEIRGNILCSRHFINPVDSNTIITLIQDNVLGMWFITKNKDQILSKLEFMQLLNTTQFFDITRVWEIEETGEKFRLINLLECILPKDLTLHKKGIKILNGKWISGLLHKGNIKMLLKVIFHNYGSENTKRILAAMQKLSDSYLMKRGYTIGVDDCVIPDNIKKKINNEIILAQEDNYKLLHDYDSESIIVPITNTYMEDFENRSLNITNRCDKSCNKILDNYLDELEKKGTPNNFIYMAESESKGGRKNLYQILNYVGQQIVDGERIPLTYNKRTLPHYTKHEQSLPSRGFIMNSYSDGLTPYEFFMLGAGSRTGLIDKALKTADIGYLSRKLVKLLESIVAQYDSTIRMNGQIISDSFGGYHFDTTYLCNNKLHLHKMDVNELLKVYSW